MKTVRYNQGPDRKTLIGVHTGGVNPKPNNQPDKIRTRNARQCRIIIDARKAGCGKGRTSRQKKSHKTRNHGPCRLSVGSIFTLCSGNCARRDLARHAGMSRHLAPLSPHVARASTAPRRFRRLQSGLASKTSPAVPRPLRKRQEASTFLPRVSSDQNQAPGTATGPADDRRRLRGAEPIDAAASDLSILLALGNAHVGLPALAKLRQLTAAPSTINSAPQILNRFVKFDRRLSTADRYCGSAQRNRTCIQPSLICIDANGLVSSSHRPYRTDGSAQAPSPARQQACVDVQTPGFGRIRTAAQTE